MGECRDGCVGGTVGGYGIIVYCSCSCTLTDVDLTWKSTPYMCENVEARAVYIDALTGMFYAVYYKEMRKDVVPFFNAIVRNLVLQCIMEATGMSMGYCIYANGLL